MPNDALTSLRSQAMKAADFLLIATALVSFSASMFAGLMVDTCVDSIQAINLSPYGQIRVAFDAATVKAYLGVSTAVLAAVVLVYFGLRRMSSMQGGVWDHLAMGCLAISVLFPFPGGVAHWVIAGFDPVQFAPGSFLAFHASVLKVLCADKMFEAGHWHWLITIVKSALAILVTSIYVSTFKMPLEPLKAIRLA